jgi:hypothetical protein
MENKQNGVVRTAIVSDMDGMKIHEKNEAGKNYVSAHLSGW